MFTNFVPISPVPPITTIFIFFSYAFELTFEEREQVGVDDVGVRRDHAVRQIFDVGLSKAFAQRRKMSDGCNI
jgi:hypothetical protein